MPLGSGGLLLQTIELGSKLRDHRRDAQRVLLRLVQVVLDLGKARFDRPVIHAAQLVDGVDVERAHEMRYVVAIRPTRPGALATRQPDLLFRNVGELVHRNPLNCRLT